MEERITRRRRGAVRQMRTDAVGGKDVSSPAKLSRNRLPRGLADSLSSVTDTRSGSREGEKGNKKTPRMDGNSDKASVSHSSRDQRQEMDD